MTDTERLRKAMGGTYRVGSDSQVTSQQEICAAIVEEFGLNRKAFPHARARNLARAILDVAEGK